MVQSVGKFLLATVSLNPKRTVQRLLEPKSRIRCSVHPLDMNCNAPDATDARKRPVALSVRNQSFATSEISKFLGSK